MNKSRDQSINRSIDRSTDQSIKLDTHTHTHAHIPHTHIVIHVVEHTHTNIYRCNIPTHTHTYSRMHTHTHTHTHTESLINKPRHLYYDNAFKMAELPVWVRRQQYVIVISFVSSSLLSFVVKTTQYRHAGL